MISFNKLNHNWMRVCTLALGLLLSGASVWEYGKTQQLLETNQQNTTARIERLLVEQLNQKIAQYPTDFQQLKSNWQSMPKTFALFESGKKRYPAELEDKELQNAAMWGRYFDQVQPDTASSRVAIVQRLREALVNGEVERVRAETEAFINHLRFYKLSPIEELVSRLAFIQVDSQSRWHESVIRRLLLDGDGQFQPAIYFMFVDKQGLSSNDVERAITMVNRSLKQAAIPSTDFTAWQQAMEYQAQRVTASDEFILNRDSLVKNIDDNQLIVPINIRQQLTQLAATLVDVGLLEVSDTITLNGVEMTAISNLSLTVSKESWQRQQLRFKTFLLAKLAFVILFMLALLALIKRYQSAQQQHMEKVAMQQKFISFVGHELKTPLASIRLMAETLDKRNKKQLSLKDYPDRIVQESDKLTLMVDNILSLQRLQNDIKPLQTAELNLHELIGREVQLLSDKYPTSLEVELEFDSATEINTNAELFSLVVRNILDNACKYLGDQPAKVNIAYQADSQELTFWDNGKGIREAEPNRVFELFMQSDDNQQGFGLGLALCKTIMQRLKGDIWIAETSPKGTCWKVRLNDVESE